MTALAQVRRLARRVDAATPPHRDRAVDALRALAIAGVIAGHWLVTALVAGAGQGGTVLRDDSPLASMPWLTPLSWVFQTLAVFFLVGGYSSARGYRGGYRAWLRKRLVRLARPVAALAAVWIPVTIGMCLAGVPATTVHTISFLVISPLWFLGVYAGLTAMTPAALWLVRRSGAWAAAFPAGLVAVADLVRFGLHGPSWVGWVNLPAGWLVPYLLGIAWALGSLRGRRGPALMLAGGAAATAALIIWAGYPASMVGVNGAHISNLNPPTLAAVTFGIAQCGLALLLRDRLARAMRRPLAWAAVAMVNLSAMTLFLWHETALVTVSSLGLLAGRVPGLLTAPAGGAWVAERLVWLPVFAAVLAGLWLTFRRVEHQADGNAGRPRLRSKAGGRIFRGLERGEEIPEDWRNWFMFTRYDSFVVLAESLQWDEATIDFAADKQAWLALDATENAQVLGLIAGFCIAESAVSGHLGSFQAAACDDSVAAAFRAQARDEQRHARFFDRVAAEVAAVPGDGIAARQDALRTLVSPDLVALFEERLPAAALRLAEDREGLTAAVGLYHMVLEGVVLLAGQNAMLDTLERLSAGLPGVRRGVELVLRDERWHIGFGTRLVQGAGLGQDEVEELLALGQAAAGAWGDLVSPGAAERAARIHRNRLRGVGVKFF